MIDWFLGKVERCEFNEQIHLEREGWPAMVIHFHVAASVMLGYEKGLQFQIWCKSVFDQVKRIDTHFFPHNIYQLLYSLAFFSLNKVALSSLSYLWSLKEGQFLNLWKESSYRTLTALFTLVWWNLVSLGFAICKLCLLLNIIELQETNLCERYHTFKKS